ncbi:DUF4239 domain-containing protein [Devosia sp. ZB163]|uniref:bestrophin-like domain n=1 Tax=Devosia sp. ZB163 TaxID=3025938 RepID=UPI002362337F|nr:DUF4239 domain-containing protein [Devosia sp. ZB163]MDC9824983.1 DUF4239 domain-containing protein [Devosia sp. ZB163]
MIAISQMPLWLAGLVLVLIPTALAMAMIFLIRRVAPLELLRQNNEVAGFQFAVVGVLYAVLLAFAVIVVWELFSEAEGNVATEAGAAATLYRLADGAAAPTGPTIRAAVTTYLESVVGDEWPAMEHGRTNAGTTRALDGLYAATLALQPANDHDRVLLTELLTQLNVLTEARRSRLVAAEGSVPALLWVVLLGGAVVTVGFTFFFGAPNPRAQALMTGILSVLIFSGLLVIVAIEHPFSGDVRLSPEAIAEVLDDLKGS